jgi:predicted permease
VLEETLGEWARGVAIQYDYFACTPLLLSLGIMLARSHGEGGEGENPLLELLKVPALWAAVAAVGLNLGGVEIHPWLEGLLERLAPVISPLMLIALGMGLRWDTLRPNQVVLLLPVLVIQLLLVPALALGLGFFGPLSPDLLVAVTLEAAMPTMVLGVVLCDRYKLDSPLYASAVTLSTLVSLATLPLWLQWLT